MQTVSGEVQTGKARGRTLGYPTINLSFNEPAVSGVYSGLVHFDDGSSHPAAIFADPTREIIEAHILDFIGDLYGQSVKIELQEKIRDSKKFDNDDELKAAIGNDIKKVRLYFNK